MRRRLGRPAHATLVGLRRRGFTPGIRAMVESTGVTKQNAWIEDTVLDGCLRADLDPSAPRALAVLRAAEIEADQLR